MVQENTALEDAHICRNGESSLGANAMRHEKSDSGIKTKRSHRRKIATSLTLTCSVLLAIPASADPSPVQKTSPTNIELIRKPETSMQYARDSSSTNPGQEKQRARMNLDKSEPDSPQVNIGFSKIIATDNENVTDFCPDQNIFLHQCLRSSNGEDNRRKTFAQKKNMAEETYYPPTTVKKESDRREETKTHEDQDTSPVSSDHEFHIPSAEPIIPQEVALPAVQTEVIQPGFATGSLPLSNQETSFDDQSSYAVSPGPLVEEAGPDAPPEIDTTLPTPSKPNPESDSWPDQRIAGPIREADGLPRDTKEYARLAIASASATPGQKQLQHSREAKLSNVIERVSNSIIIENSTDLGKHPNGAVELSINDTNVQDVKTSIEFESHTESNKNKGQINNTPSSSWSNLKKGAKQVPWGFLGEPGIAFVDRKGVTVIVSPETADAIKQGAPAPDIEDPESMRTGDSITETRTDPLLSQRVTNNFGVTIGSPILGINVPIELTETDEIGSYATVSRLRPHTSAVISGEFEKHTSEQLYGAGGVFNVGLAGGASDNIYLHLKESSHSTGIGKIYDIKNPHQREKHNRHYKEQHTDINIGDLYFEQYIGERKVTSSSGARGSSEVIGSAFSEKLAQESNATDQQTNSETTYHQNNGNQISEPIKFESKVSDSRTGQSEGSVSVEINTIKDLTTGTEIQEAKFDTPNSEYTGSKELTKDILKQMTASTYDPLVGIYESNPEIHGNEVASAVIKNDDLRDSAINQYPAAMKGEPPVNHGMPHTTADLREVSYALAEEKKRRESFKEKLEIIDPELAAAYARDRLFEDDESPLEAGKSTSNNVKDTAAQSEEVVDESEIHSQESSKQSESGNAATLGNNSPEFDSRNEMAGPLPGESSAENSREEIAQEPKNETQPESMDNETLDSGNDLRSDHGVAPKSISFDFGQGSVSIDKPHTFSEDLVASGPQDPAEGLSEDVEIEGIPSSDTTSDTVFSETNPSSTAVRSSDNGSTAEARRASVSASKSNSDQSDTDDKKAETTQSDMVKSQDRSNYTISRDNDDANGHVDGQVGERADSAGSDAMSSGAEAKGGSSSDDSPVEKASSSSATSGSASAKSSEESSANSCSISEGIGVSDTEPSLADVPSASAGGFTSGDSSNSDYTPSSKDTTDVLDDYSKAGPR